MCKALWKYVKTNLSGFDPTVIYIFLGMTDSLFCSLVGTSFIKLSMLFNLNSQQKSFLPHIFFISISPFPLPTEFLFCSCRFSRWRFTKCNSSSWKKTPTPTSPPKPNKIFLNTTEKIYARTLKTVKFIWK